MKNESCVLLSWVIVLLLLLINSEPTVAPDVYRNNEYEVSEIDKRIAIPKPDLFPYKHQHTGFKRQQINLLEQSARKHQHPPNIKRHPTNLAEHQARIHARPSHRQSQHVGLRRQEIIHALNEDNDKVDSEEDIESLGRRIDQTGNEIKDVKPISVPLPDKHTAAATRYIISKIKEIQEKLFKRTENKDLEAKLNQMATSVGKDTKVSNVSSSSVQNTTLTTAEVKNITVDNTSHTEKKEINTTKAMEGSDNVKPQGDGSKVPDRRKIIPEEVVDKILEKFQQLKQEAKHIAVSESRHSVEHAEEKDTKAEDGYFNPYASIGKPRKGGNKRNTTVAKPYILNTLPESMSNLLSPKGNKIGSIQIPIGSFGNNNVKGGKKGVGPVPIMFIKNGANLVPVFGSMNNLPVEQEAPSAQASPVPPASPQLSVSGNLRAQLDGNAGVAEPSFPMFVAQMKGNPTGDARGGPTIADHIRDKLNINSGVADPSDMPSRMSSTYSNYKMPQTRLSINRNRADDEANFERFKMENEMEMNNYGGPINNEAPTSRCSVPGRYNCDEAASQIQGLMNQGNDYRNYHNPRIPSTEEIIQSVLHSPDFPMVAAHILHNSLIPQGREQSSSRNTFSTPESRYHSNLPSDEIPNSNYNTNEMTDGNYRSNDMEDSRNHVFNYPQKETGYSKYHQGEMQTQYLSNAPRLQEESESRDRQPMQTEYPSNDPHFMPQLPSQAMMPQLPNGLISSFMAQPTEGNDDKISFHNAPQGFNERPSDINGPLSESTKDVHYMSYQDMNQPSTSNYQGMSPGAIQFNMQQNLAQNIPGEMSMIDNKHMLPVSSNAPEPPALDMRNLNPLSEDLQRQVGLQPSLATAQVSPFIGQGSSSLLSGPSMDDITKGSSRHVISGSRSDNPYQNPRVQSFVDQMHNKEMLSNIDRLSTNDISDPEPKLDQSQPQSEFMGETPDQLLEYAKQKSFQQQYQSTAMDRLDRERMESDESLPNMDPPPYMPSQIPMLVSKSQIRDTQMSSDDPAELLDTVHNHQFDFYANHGRTSTRHRGVVMSSKPEMSSSFNTAKDDLFSYDHSPDVLLEMLRKQKDKKMGFLGGYMDTDTFTKYKKARYAEDSARARGEIPVSVDPSLADDVNSDDSSQQMEIQSKEVASQNKKDSRFLRNRKLASLHHNEISVVPGNIVQYNHGKMSMDPADVVNSFVKENNYYFRNKIPYPRNNTHPFVRASVVHKLKNDGIELRINGKKVIQTQKSRRSKLDKKSKNPNGETFFSKGPITVELSHGANKSKIINIVTVHPFNVTDDRRRTNIAKNVHD